MNDTLGLVLIGISFVAGIFVYKKIDETVEKINPIDNIKHFFGVN